MRMWNRKLWGVEFSSPRGKPMLIGSFWDNNHKPTPYEGEPTRALLFCTRAQARNWCAEMYAEYAKYPHGHCCASWRFRPVRVVETVRRVP